MQKLTQEDWAVMGTAAAYVNRGEFEKALATFSSVECHTTNPRELATILLNKAQCYRMLQNFATAHTECDRALDLSKENDEDTVDAWIVKAAILVDEGNIADALSVVEVSLRRYPSVNRNLQLLKKGELLASQEEYAEAIPILSQLLQTNEFDESEIAAVHHTLGVSYGAVGAYDDAAEHLLKAQSLQLPEGYLANNSFWLASIAAKRGDFHTAKSDLLNALSQAEHSNVDLLADIYESLANVSRELGDDSDAALYTNLWRASNRTNPSD